MPNPDLSIIIVSWNVKNLLEKCLASIFKYQGTLPLEVIVVDNASSDNTAEMIRQEFPQVALVANQKNLGFGSANNQGIMKANSSFILVLNPDTEILENTLQKMLEFMEKNHQVGIAGGKHFNPDWTIQPSVRRFPTFWALFFILTKIAKIFPLIPPVYRYLARGFDYKIAQVVDQVAGSFLMIRRQTIDEIGLFDENFFLWFEEVDLCKRAKAAGWQVWYTPDGEIIHYGGQSFSQKLTWQKQKLFFQSAWYYLKKHRFGRN